MARIIRKVDAKGRVTIPEIAGKTVMVDRRADGEIRICPVKEPRRHPSFPVLMTGVTDDNLPEKIDFGAPQGKEQL